MKKVAYVVERYYQGNAIFDSEQTKITVRDNTHEKYHILHDAFEREGYEIATDDINTIETSDVVIYRDMPKLMPSESDREKSYLILMESPLIRPDNLDTARYKYFKKVFTWDDDLVDGKKYIKINYHFPIPKTIPKRFEKRALCCLIVGNKSSDHRDELYSERKRVVRWFEQNHADDFDLYGVGWNEYRFRGPIYIRALNRVAFLKKMMFNAYGESFPAYKGKADNKFETMQEYRFAICYENIKDVSGYITEKLFDAFFAGCIPVYRGAGNVTEYIPKSCFVDKRDFETLEKLYEYISSMDKETYLGYLDAIEHFLNSKRADPFRAESFADTLITEIVKDRKG